jgi:RNA ligase
MVMGGKARAYVMEVNGTESIHEIDSSFAYAGEKSSVGMHESLIPFEDLYNLGYLSKSEMENLVLYKYNDKTTYEKYWNEYTTAARGIVFNKYTGECVARPFPKFFNLGENEASNYKNLPLDQKYEVYDKLDGSCGILFWHNNKPCITTMGSFTSDQAIEATKIINNRYDISDLSRDITIIFEIIYPENKIVCDYKDTRDLFLLSAFNRHTGVELSRIKVKAIADKYGFPLVNKRKITIESAIKQQKTLPKDREGFVVRFANGLRVKIKGEEYLKIHKAISNMSPLSIWEAMENGKLKDSFKAQMPEELTKDIEIIEKQLSDQFHRTLKEIEYEVKIVGIPKELNPENRKKIGLFISENKERLIHPSAIFPFLLNQKQAIEKYIMNFIRPTGNKIKER